MMVRSEQVIAAEINAIKEQARATMVASAIEIGKRLAEAKEIVAHGNWGKWLEENVDYSERTAQNLMKCWEEYGKKGNPQALAGLTLTKAIALLGVAPEQRNELIESGEAEELSVRQLQKRIEELKAEADNRQVRIEELMGALEEKQESEAQSPGEIEALERAIQETGKQLEEMTRRGDDLTDQLASAQQRGDMNAKRADAAAKRALEAEQKATEAEQKTAEAERKLAEAEQALQEARQQAAVIEQVEVQVTPPEVEEELRRLREISAKAPNAGVIRLRDAYARALKEFEHVCALLAELDGAEQEKYRAAIRAGLEKMTEKL